MIDKPALQYNLKNGIVTVHGIEAFACFCDYSISEENQKIILKITTNGNEYIIESEPKTLLGGYGSIGRLIADFDRNYSSLKAASWKVWERHSVNQGIIPHIEPPAGVLLKKGEYAVKTDVNVKFCQERTKTTYQGKSIRIRLMKGVSIGGGKGKPIKEEYLATLDEGRLVLTNKRIIFFGDTKSFTIPLQKLVAIERYSDAIELTKENVLKKTTLIGLDGNLYADIIEKLFNEI